MSSSIELVIGKDSHVLGPGSFIGRSSSCDIHVLDGRVSEAHALVTIRQNRWWVLALRGRIYVGGRAVDNVKLERGTKFSLTGPSDAGAVIAVTVGGLAVAPPLTARLDQGPPALLSERFHLVSPTFPGTDDVPAAPHLVRSDGGYALVGIEDDAVSVAAGDAYALPSGRLEIEAVASSAWTMSPGGHQPRVRPWEVWWDPMHEAIRFHDLGGAASLVTLTRNQAAVLRKLWDARRAGHSRIACYNIGLPLNVRSGKAWFQKEWDEIRKNWLWRAERAVQRAWPGRDLYFVNAVNQTVELVLYEGDVWHHPKDIVSP